nr:MAG TPA: anaerobic ribonucleoside triphosphate reductase [Caudoviricetes sp.]
MVETQSVANMSDQEILANLESQRTKCVVYSRVMGYHRPVEGFNIGKKVNTKNVSSS